MQGWNWLTGGSWSLLGEGVQLPGESCCLLREGVQLPGESCFPPRGEGEQWPVYGWEIDLDCLFDCLLGLIVVLAILLLVRLLLLLAWLLRKLSPSDERWTVAGGELLPSPGGRTALAGEGLQELVENWASLFIGLVIFPSFLATKWFNLLICLCLTLLNLSSLTLLMKPWHSSSLSTEMIDASLALHSCISLLTWSKILLIAFTQACSKSFSAYSDDLSSLGSV